jgi:hypothetical protein
LFNLANSQKRLGLALVVLLVAGLGLAWLWPNGPLSQPKAAATTANDVIPAYNDSFRFGTNMGHRNDNWSDAQYSDLIAAQGMNSFRVFLPENYLATWGYDVALANMQHYQTLGLNNLTANLGTPSRAHSKALPTTPDWQLDYYSPQNLYEPIWASDGSINPNNYWAAYVYKTVSLYRSYVKIWEIWNEPDYTNNWGATQTDWWNNAPGTGDLPHWNDDIFSYIRMLRVSYEVIKKVDPSALVATGGLGYESFLDAILRYTDNPAGGVATFGYPLTGGAYFDVLSYHYYPQYGVQNLATGQWNNQTDSDNAVANLVTLRDNFKGILAKHGYGSTYPAKYFIVTETGFSSQPVGGNAGSSDLERNYLMKLAILARLNDLKQVHTFMLSDEEPDSILTDSYKHMGLYYDIAGLTSPAQAQRKAASYGVETVVRTLAGATYDAKATAALNFPSNVRGVVFQNGTQQITLVWLRTSNSSENVTASVSVPVGTNQIVRDWQWSLTKASPTINVLDGQVQLTLSASPVLLLSSAAATPTPTTTVAAAPTVTPTVTIEPTITPTTTIAATTTPTATEITVAPTVTPTVTVETTVTPTATVIPATTVAPTATQTTPVPVTTTVAPAPTPTPTLTVAPTNTPVPTATGTPAPTATQPVATPSVKLAISGVQASGSDPATSPTNVVDGNPATFWAVNNAPASAWLQLDLGANKAVAEVRYFVTGVGHAPDTKVQYSLDGVNWTTLPNANGIDTGANWGWNSLNAGKVTARYVRFYLDNANKASWSLGYYGEIEVWGN